MNLNWALEKEHVERLELLDPDSREIVWLDILDLLSHIEQPWVLDPDNLNYRSEKKVKEAKEHFENGGWMDPAEVQGRVSVVWPQHSDDHRIMIENRHRLIAALQLEEKYAPFSIPLDLVEELKSTVKNVAPK